MAEENPDLGLHADPRRAEERRPSRGPLDHRAHPEGARPAARAGAADLVADVSRARIGARLPGRTSSRPRSGRGAAWSPTTRCLSSILASRRVQILGSTPHPERLFMRQVGRTLTAADDGLLRDHRVLICDRDRKWSRGRPPAVLRRRRPRGRRRRISAPNANAYAERCAPRRRREETAM